MVVIVGGGISGLGVAWHLTRLGEPCVVLEAGERPGGVIRTERSGSGDGPLPLDVGPQRTRLTRDVRTLVEGAGLLDRTVEAPSDLPLFVWRGGRLREVPFSLRAAFATDLLSWREKLRVLAEPFTDPPSPDETVERLFTRKFGPAAYRALVGPLYGGLYASDPARMHVRHGLAMTLENLGVEGSLLLALLRRGGRARSRIPTVSFEGGMGELPCALAATLGERVRRESAAVALRGSPGAWSVELASGEAVPADRVVLSLPAPPAAHVLAPVAPDAAARVARLRYNPLAVVHLHTEAELRGFGYQVAFGEPLRTRGVTWSGSIFGRGGLCAAYLGGMAAPEVVDWSDERLARTAVEEFRTVTGHSARVLNVARTRVPAWDRTWDALEGLRLPEGVEVCAAWNARPGIPGRAEAARKLAERLAA